MKKKVTEHSSQNSQSATSASESRRSFVKKVAAGTVGASTASLLSLRSHANALNAKSYNHIVGANNKIQIGFLGTGRMSRGHLRNLLNDHTDKATVLSFCDVYKKNLEFAKTQVPAAKTYLDHRELLASSDIDAVIIGSPDHWHALHTIHACDAGKDVYVEKPISVYIGEGRKMVEAASRNNRIVQVGTQQRSNEAFIEAKSLVQSGKIGEITFVRTWNYGNKYPDGIGSPPDSEPFEGLDWDRWLGPAPFVPFNENRFGAIQDDAFKYKWFSSFRWFWDYAGGMMTDWGVHLLDIVLWVMDESYPDTVSATGGKFLLQDNRETPDTIQSTFKFDSFVCTYENRTTNSRPLDNMGYGISFHGTRGTLMVNRGGLVVHPENKEDSSIQFSSPGGAHSKHMANFLDCVASRKQPICDIETGHRSTSIAILGNLAYRTGQQVIWDGEQELIHGNEAASQMLMPQYRKPWKI